MDMVRFKLFCRTRSADMRMEFPTLDHVEEIGGVLNGACGDELILRNGYRMLSPDEVVGDMISDGDMVEAIPDPETYFQMSAFTRV